MAAIGTHPDVIVNILFKDSSSPVVGVKIHVKSIYDTVAMIVDDDCAARRPVGLAGTVRLYACEPSRIRGNIVHGRQIDVGSVVGIKLI